ncbi:MAG: hypothetical protein GX444_05325 [Myxococcales bacterium]|nr:hypothetical protein [Myxococcales bacterium]
MNRPAVIGAFLLLSWLFFGTAAFAAETFVVYQPQVEGFDASTANVVGQLLATEMERQDGAKAAYVAGDTACGDEACAKAALAQNVADVAVVGKLLKLGNKAIFIVTVVRKNGTTPMRLTADDVGELDRLMPRLAHAIYTGQSFEEAQTVTTVSEAERQTYKRVTGDFSWGPGIQTIVPVAESYAGGNDILLGFVLPFRYEIANWGFEFRTGIYFDDQSSEYNHVSEFPLDFSGMYYFSQGVGSPFAGLTVGIHYLNVIDKVTDDEQKKNDREIWEGKAKATATGNSDYLVDKLEDKEWNRWAPSLAVFGGYEFLRTHTFHVDARLGYQYDIIGLDGKGAHGPFLAVHFTFGHEGK